MMRAILPALVGVATLSPGGARADTDVFGRINREIRWTLDGSPYRLVGDVVVGPNGLVLIDPGVEVVALPEGDPGEGEDPTRVELVVEGRLVAGGNAEAPVVFRPADADAAGGWHGLRLEGEGTVRLQHAQIHGAVRAIDGRSPSPPEALSTASFHNCQTGLYWASRADLDLQATAIRGDCQRAVEAVPAEEGRRDLVRIRASEIEGGVVVAGTDAVVVSGNEIRNGTDGVSVEGATDVRVDGNHVGLTEGIRVLADGPAAVVGNTIVSCFVRTGIEVAATDTLVANNVLGNAWGGIAVSQTGEAEVRVLHNTVVRAVRWPGLELRGADAPDQVRFQGNIVALGATPGVVFAEGTERAAFEYNDVWGNSDDTVAEGGRRVGNLSVNPRFVAEPEVLVLDAGLGPQSLEPQHVQETTDCANHWADVTFPEWALVTRLDVTLDAAWDGRAACQVYIYRPPDDAQHLLDLGQGHHEESTPWVQTRVFRWVARPWCRGDPVVCEVTWDFERLVLRPVSELPMDLRLVEQSPLIDSAVAIEGLATDRAGRARAIDGDFDGVPVPDLGAYEFRLNLSPRAEAGGDREVWRDEEVVFDGSGSADPDGEIVAWRWDFGDFTQGEGEVVRHVYDEDSPPEGYRLTLTVVDSDGAEARDVATVVVRERPDNVLPEADAGGDREGLVGREMVFDGSGSADADGEVVAWRWGFGDGASAEGEVVRHVRRRFFWKSCTPPVVLGVEPQGHEWTGRPARPSWRGAGSPRSDATPWPPARGARSSGRGCTGAGPRSEIGRAQTGSRERPSRTCPHCRTCARYRRAAGPPQARSLPAARCASCAALPRFGRAPPSPGHAWGGWAPCCC